MIGLINIREGEPKEGGFANYIGDFLLCRHASLKASEYCANKLMKAIDKVLEEQAEQAIRERRERS